MSFFICIDSRNKSSGNNSDFSVSLSDFSVQYGSNVSISLDSVSFYNMQLPINSTNNTIVFQEDSVAANIVATLTPGNYNGDDMATEIQTQLNATGANTYTVSYNDNNGKLTLGTTLPNTIKLITINEILGFPASSDFSQSIIASNPAILSGGDYVDLLLPGLINSNMNTGYNNNGLLHRITLSGSWGDLISYNSSESNSNVIIEYQNLSNLRVQLKNPDGTFYQLPDNAYLSIILKCQVQF